MSCKSKKEQIYVRESEILKIITANKLTYLLRHAQNTTIQLQTHGQTNGGYH